MGWVLRIEKLAKTISTKIATPEFEKEAGTHFEERYRAVALVLGAGRKRRRQHFAHQSPGVYETAPG